MEKGDAKEVEKDDKRGRKEIKGNGEKMERREREENEGWGGKRNGEGNREKD